MNRNLTHRANSREITMEPETIQKNGASPKSQTSRENDKMKKIIIISFLLFVGIFSCNAQRLMYYQLKGILQMNNKEQVENYLMKEGFQKINYHKAFGKTIVQCYANCCYAVFVKYTFDTTIPYEIYLSDNKENQNKDWKLYLDEFSGYGFKIESHKYDGDTYSEKIMWESDVFKDVLDTVEMSKNKNPSIFSLIMVRWNFLYYE